MDDSALARKPGGNSVEKAAAQFPGSVGAGAGGIVQKLHAGLPVELAMWNFLIDANTAQAAKEDIEAAVVQALLGSDLAETSHRTHRRGAGIVRLPAGLKQGKGDEPVA